MDAGMMQPEFHNYLFLATIQNQKTMKQIVRLHINLEKKLH